MAVRMPYAAADSVMRVLGSLGQRRLPGEFSPAYIAKAYDMSASMAVRVLFTFRHLGLVDGHDRPTSDLSALVRAQSSAQFTRRLREIVERAYRDVFDGLDLTKSTFADIMRAFEDYDPHSQRYRMALLFIGLCHAADIPMQAELKQFRSARAPGTRRPRERPARRSSRKRKLPAVLASKRIYDHIDQLPAPGAVYPREMIEAWITVMRDALLMTYEDAPRQPEQSE